MLLAVALQAGIEWLVTDVLKLRSILVIKDSVWSFNHLPNPWTMAKNIAEGLILRNVLQYYIHLYLLHYLSSTYLTRRHLAWQHSIRAPYSFVANYDHPICFLLHHLLPLYLPAYLFRFHIMTYPILLAIFSLAEVFTYSGYNVLPSTIMLRGMARRTDAHMMSVGKGNYAPIGVLDWCHGTTLGADVMDDVRGEMEKHDVQERAGKAMDDMGTRQKGRARRSRGKK